VCALLAAVLYGIQYTPVKAFPVYDGSKFQWFMSCGIAFSGLCAAYIFSSVPLVLIPHGLLGGILWGTANVLVLPTVKFLGLGVGFAMYHSINMCVGYAIGRFGLLGAPKESATNPALRDTGLWLLVISLVFMIFVEPEIVDAEDSLSRTSSAGALDVSINEKNKETEKSRMDRLLNQAALKYQARKVKIDALTNINAQRTHHNSIDIKDKDQAVFNATLSPPNSTKKNIPKIRRHFSVDQLDNVSMNANVRMARRAYQNWRRGSAKGAVETSSGIVGAYGHHTRDTVQNRAQRLLWPLFLDGSDVTVQTRYRSMISSASNGVDSNKYMSLRSATLNAVARRANELRSNSNQKNNETDRLMTASGSSSYNLEEGSNRFHIDKESTVSSRAIDNKKQRFVVGGICGVFAGLFCGTNMLPFVLYLKALPSGQNSITWNQTISFMLSQTFGVFVAATICLAIFTIIALTLDITLKSPAVWPPWISGTIWTAGFLLASIAVSDLGMAEAYTYDAIGPVMLSAIISFFCGEIVGTLNTTLFLIALALQTTGVLCIAVGA